MLSVKTKFKLLCEKKVIGPDGIMPKLLNTCADQLGEVYIYIFCWSLRICEVPMLFKESPIIPVPKK